MIAPVPTKPERAEVQAGPGEAGAAPSLTPDLRTLARRRRPWIVISIALVIGAIVLVVVQGTARAPGTPLGADNAAPPGARALVQVLRSQGVAVREARTLDAAVEQARDGATVFLHDELGVLDRDRIEALDAAADRLVVARPDFAALEVLAPGVRLAGAAEGAIDDVTCEVTSALRAGELSDGQRLLTVDADAAASGFSGCFASGEGYAVVVGDSPTGTALALVGGTTPFENESVDERGNAALAIGLLGATDQVVWYLPGPADTDAADAPTLAELTPGWVSPVMVLLIVVTIVAGIWRGRRFGPLVVEDLPVHVPAEETGEGRARLYARSSARDRALDQLRIGAIRRIAEALRLPRTVHVDAVVTGAADVSGRAAASVRALLVDAAATGDRELVALARDLDALEREVRAALRPAPDASEPTGRRP